MVPLFIDEKCKIELYKNVKKKPGNTFIYFRLQSKRGRARKGEGKCKKEMLMNMKIKLFYYILSCIYRYMGSFDLFS